MTEAFTVRVSKICDDQYINKCENIISGCNKDPNKSCFEKYRDHIDLMLFLTNQKILDSFSRIIRIRYYEYLFEALNELFKDNDLSAELEKLLYKFDPVKIAILFHDIGKCTQDNQRKLYNSCSAPNHEIISVMIAYDYLQKHFTKLFKDRGYIIFQIYIIPVALSILLHHHAMRNLKDLLKEYKSVKLQKEDFKYLFICLKENHEVYDRLTQEDFKYYVNNFDLNSVEKIKENITNCLSSLEMGKALISREQVYSIAIMITFVIHVADILAALLNRNKYGERCLSIEESKMFLSNIYTFKEFIESNELMRKDLVKAIIDYIISRDCLRKHLKNILGD